MHDVYYQNRLTMCEALIGVLRNRGKGHLFQGNGNKGPSFRDTGNKTILGNREHKKTNFQLLGNRGTSQFISGEQGNRYPPPPLKASCVGKISVDPDQLALSEAT